MDLSPFLRHLRENGPRLTGTLNFQSRHHRFPNPRARREQPAAPHSPKNSLLSRFERYLVRQNVRGRVFRCQDTLEVLYVDDTYRVNPTIGSGFGASA